MKILFIAPRYHTNQHFVVKTLIDNGHTVRFFSIYSARNEEHSALEPEILEHSLLFRVVARLKGDPGDRLSKFKLQFAFPSPYVLYREIRSFEPDVIIVRELNNFSLLAIAIARILSIKVLYYHQESICAPKTTGGRKKLLSVLEKITGGPIISVTPVRGDCRRYSPLPHTYYLPMIVDFKFSWEEKEHFIDNKFNILMVGKYIERKNHLLLLKACSELKNEIPIQLTIVIGEEKDANYGGYPASIQKYIRENDLESIVRIERNMSFQEVQKEYPKHDLFVLPSANEPFAISILEAMGHGLPVICSDTNGAQYCVKEGINGFICKTNDASDLTEKIESIIRDRDLTVKMGEASLEIAENEYGPQNYYSEFLKIIQKT